MTVGLITCAVALILALWTLAFELNRVGDALWHMQADLHDIRCSIYAVGEPANALLRAQLEKHTAAKRIRDLAVRPEWLPEVHDGPNCFPD
jgi:hypothetical protein